VIGAVEGRRDCGYGREGGGEEGRVGVGEGEDGAAGGEEGGEGEADACRGGVRNAGLALKFSGFGRECEDRGVVEVGGCGEW